MCLAIPMLVKSIDKTQAEVELDGTTQTISLMLIKDIKPGDYVIVHAGYAIEKLKEEEAKEVMDLWEQIDEQS